MRRWQRSNTCWFISNHRNNLNDSGNQTLTCREISFSSIKRRSNKYDAGDVKFLESWIVLICIELNTAFDGKCSSWKSVTKFHRQTHEEREHLLLNRGEQYSCNGNIPPQRPIGEISRVLLSLSSARLWPGSRTPHLEELIDSVVIADKGTGKIKQMAENGC